LSRAVGTGEFYAARDQQTRSLRNAFAGRRPATASGMVLGLGSALAGIGYVVLGRVQETVGLTSGILIGFSVVIPAALIALAVLLRARGATPVPAQ
jgi:hypothetical protein